MTTKKQTEGVNLLEEKTRLLSPHGVLALVVAAVAVVLVPHGGVGLHEHQDDLRTVSHPGAREVRLRHVRIRTAYLRTESTSSALLSAVTVVGLHCMLG